MNRMRELLEELETKTAKVFEMGGEKRIARQHGRNKLTARERIDKLLDADTFLEMGIHGSEYTDKLIPADGVITGLGKIDGRDVCVAAYDFTVLGGSIGIVSQVKVAPPHRRQGNRSGGRPHRPGGLPGAQPGRAAQRVQRPADSTDRAGEYGRPQSMFAPEDPSGRRSQPEH
jgi:hypothetical protein